MTTLDTNCFTTACKMATGQSLLPIVVSETPLNENPNFQQRLQKYTCFHPESRIAISIRKDLFLNGTRTPTEKSEEGVYSRTDGMEYWLFFEVPAPKPENPNINFILRTDMIKISSTKKSKSCLYVTLDLLDKSRTEIEVIKNEFLQEVQGIQKRIEDLTVVTFLLVRNDFNDLSEFSSIGCKVISCLKESENIGLIQCIFSNNHSKQAKEDPDFMSVNLTSETVAIKNSINRSEEISTNKSTKKRNFLIAGIIACFVIGLVIGICIAKK